MTGIAGLLVGTWALSQMGMVYGAPNLHSRFVPGHFGDHGGIPGSQLLMLNRWPSRCSARCACPTASSIKKRT